MWFKCSNLQMTTTMSCMLLLLLSLLIDILLLFFGWKIPTTSSKLRRPLEMPLELVGMLSIHDGHSMYFTLFHLCHLFTYKRFHKIFGWHSSWRAKEKGVENFPHRKHFNRRRSLSIVLDNSDNKKRAIIFDLCILDSSGGEFMKKRRRKKMKYKQVVCSSAMVFFPFGYFDWWRTELAEPSNRKENNRWKFLFDSHKMCAVRATSWKCVQFRSVECVNNYFAVSNCGANTITIPLCIDMILSLSIH